MKAQSKLMWILLVLALGLFGNVPSAHPEKNTPPDLILSLSLPDIAESEILAWSWGASNSGNMHTGSGGNGKASFQDISVSRHTDDLSPIILLRVATLEPLDNATLQHGSLKIELINVLITSYSVGGFQGEKGKNEPLVENITLNFAGFLYQVEDSDFGWDIAENDEL